MSEVRYGTNADRTRSYGRWTCCVLFLLAGSLAYGASDTPGSADLPQLERYPLSSIVDYTSVETPEYRLATGKMQKINGVISPENAANLRGALTRITYFVPPGHTSREAFEYFTQQLSSLSHKELFRCEGRNCGSSSQWANTQFGISRLYGEDRAQYYSAVQLLDENIYIALYVVRRGNKRVYVHIDALQLQSMPEKVELAKFDLMTLLKQGRRVYLPSDKEQQLKALTFSALLDLLQERPEFTLYLVGHDDNADSFESMISQSTEMALALKALLASRGADVSAIYAYGVGPLAPAYQQGVPGSRIELVPAQE
jgi:outer membrane protein OmpA-like peptidoglycan-associated protein